MPQFCKCVLFEWGWPFLVGLLIVAALVVVGLVLLFKIFGLTAPGPWRDAISFKDLSVQGPTARVFGYIAIIVLVFWVTYEGYKQVSSSFSVAFDTASGPYVALQTLRDKFQQDSEATVLIQGPAKTFSISGRFEGACAPDLFEKICRQYNEKISCKTSWIKRMVTVELNLSH